LSSTALFTYYLLTSLQNIDESRIQEHEPVEQLVHFADGNPAYDYTVPSNPDDTFDNAGTMGTALEDFFCRPVKIHEFEWSSTITAFSTFNPWTEFFTNPRVSNRISNYSLLRCKLNLKFLINGTPFQFGRLMADYIPLRGTTGPPDQLTVDRAFVTQDSIAASQRPHVFLDPTTCSGGTMELPFFWFKDYLNIVDGDWNEMGEINIRELNPLRSVHSSTLNDTVRITVLAWACDVELAMPTSSNASGLTAQSEPEYEYQAKGKKSKGKGDEYPKSGVISGPATAVQNVASALTKVPFLAPYARASEVAAGAVANIARMFGYSRPVQQTEGISEYRPGLTGSMALTNIPDNVNKLALDVKQETTVDSRTVGLDGTDEMNIKSIVSRESYLTKFTWTENDYTNSGDLPDNLLFSIAVSPILFDIESAAAPVNSWLHFTPSGYVGNLFESWHGSMRFRFQIVASKFHRGRLRFVYEPTAAPPGQVFDEYNVNYTRIVDISEERDVVINVGHGQDKYWLKAAYPSFLPFSTTAASFPIYPADGLNGTLSVYVVNDLESPDPSLESLQDVEINVFTACGDDFEFMNPSGEFLHNMTFFEPQSRPERIDPVMARRTPFFTQPDKALRTFIYDAKMRHLLKDPLTRPTTFAELESAATQCKAEIGRLERADLMNECVYWATIQRMVKQSEPETEGETSDQVDNDGNMPVNPNGTDLVPVLVKPEYSMVIPGETVKSLRSLIKRYDYHRSESGEDFLSGRWIRIYSNNFPHLRGSAPSAISLSNSPVYNWNFCNMTLLNYVMSAYAGWRGGVRWKVIPSAYAANETKKRLTVHRVPLRSTYDVDDIVATTVNSYTNDQITYARRNWLAGNPLLAPASTYNTSSGVSGVTVTHSDVNPSMEYEMPYYKRYKFVPKRSNYTSDAVYTEFHQILIEDGAGVTGDSSYEFWCAAGDDMSGFFFTGMPRIAFVEDPSPI
jgi:hypothetical protein